VKYFAVVSNVWEWTPKRLLEWHREKAGSIEAVHDVIKNELAGGVDALRTASEPMPLVAAGGVDPQRADRVEAVGPAAGVAHGTAQALRFLIFNTPGKLVHSRAQTLLRLGGLGNAFLTGRARCACYLCLLADPHRENKIFHLQKGRQTYFLPCTLLHSRETRHTPARHRLAI